jgi:hypothetical protein
MAGLLQQLVSLHLLFSMPCCLTRRLKHLGFPAAGQIRDLSGLGCCPSSMQQRSCQGAEPWLCHRR